MTENEMAHPNLRLVLDPVAEAIYETIFYETLGPEGTIERALYRDAAKAGLMAGLAAFNREGRV